MLDHHDSRSYEIAASEAAGKAREKLARIIDKGRQKASTAVEDIMKEYEIRRDSLVPGRALNFNTADEKALVPFNVAIGDRPINLTGHSQTQLFEKLGIPKIYVDRLQKMKDPWAYELLVENLKRLAEKHIGDERLLVRLVGDTAKGILSSSYRRMDASPIYEAFFKLGIEQGYVPVDGLNTDTRYHIKMLKDVIYEPAPNEVVTFGVSLTTSDYGSGALALQFFLMRLWCTNYAIAENVMRKVHLGKRFEGNEDDYEVFSQKTYELDTKTVASAVKDIMTMGLDSRIEQTCKLIEDANEKQIDVRKALDSLQKKGILTKEMSKTAETLYENVDEIVMLPQNKGAWRFSNVLSFMANSDKLAGDKTIDLQAEAWEVLKAA